MDQFRFRSYQERYIHLFYHVLQGRIKTTDVAYLSTWLLHSKEKISNKKRDEKNWRTFLSNLRMFECICSETKNIPLKKTGRLHCSYAMSDLFSMSHLYLFASQSLLFRSYSWNVVVVVVAFIVIKLLFQSFHLLFASQAWYELRW